jgi:hypothetical protein
MLAPFPMRTGSPRLGVLRGLRPTRDPRSATDLPTRTMASCGNGRPRAVPVFTVSSIGQVGAQLYPGSLAASTPQTFDVASPPTLVLGFGVDPPCSPGATHC